MKTLFFILIFISLLDAKTFRKGHLKVVLDTNTNLMWADDISAISLQLNHKDALSHCSTLKLAGFSNWRLPYIEELETIVNKKNKKNYIHKSFKFALAGDYWAYKSHWRTLWFYADYMFFLSGTPYFDSRHKKKFLRCVREMN